MALGAMGQDEESQSIGVIDTSNNKKPTTTNGKTQANREDSDLTKNIVGTEALTSKQKKKLKHLNSGKKKKKNRGSKSGSDNDENKTVGGTGNDGKNVKIVESLKPTRHSSRFNKN